MFHYKERIVGSLLLLLCMQVSLAKDLGVVGQTYPITEDDFLELIVHRLQTMQQNGELQKHQIELQNHLADKVDKPNGLSLSRTVSTRSWEYDPSVTLPYDLTDHQGHLIAKQGTTFNPLKVINLHHTLLFYDGNDKRQISWVENKIQHSPKQYKLILVNGSISESLKLFSLPIYFDQAGNLTKKFHIEHVPAIVAQDGLKLKITEIVL